MANTTLLGLADLVSGIITTILKFYVLNQFTISTITFTGFVPPLFLKSL
ncbi:hypothetical protein Q5O24_11390 [Eubacteriaceae bacterium ES3]|nr:hypothetical protein Q5O24_11390 [Eubacteriaceae bacterium ES3]